MRRSRMTSDGKSRVGRSVGTCRATPRHRAGALATVVMMVAAGLVSAFVGVASTAAPAAAAAPTISNFPSDISNPESIAAGSDGALWFTNPGNNSIGRVTTAGVKSSFRGAGISSPKGIAAGPDGALWFANRGNNSIGRITTAGAVTNFTHATINAPGGITTGPDGALWFTNFDGDSIGRITTAGAVTNFTHATIGAPGAIAAGPDGALWFTNSKLGTNSIGRITTAGAVTNFTHGSINNPTSIVAGSDGALWFTNNSDFSIGRITTAGAVTNFTHPSISGPTSIAAGPDDALWFTNQSASGRVARITTAGIVTPFSGGRTARPLGIAVGPDAALWFVDELFNTVSRVTTSGVITEMAAGNARPRSTAVGPDGALWFTNPDNDSIGRITTAGAVTNYTGTGIAGPNGIVSGPDGALWFTNPNNNSIGRITTAGAVTNFTHPTVARPLGIVAGPDGALWFTNRNNNSIGRITTAGAVTNFTHATMSGPFGIAVGPDGALWFTNSGSFSIGRITTAGAVSNYTHPTVAGPDGALWFANDVNDSIGRITTTGVVSNFTHPSIDGPFGIAVGPDGALWFTNSGSFSIGRITTAGAVSNFTHPSIAGPVGIVAGPDGALWFTNVDDDSIGRISVPVPSNDAFGSPQVLAGAAGAAVPVSNEFASMQAGEPASIAGAASSRSVWYSYTPTVPGFLTVDTCGSTFDTLVGVYTGNAVNALTAVGSNDDTILCANTANSYVFPFAVNAGTTYRIVVAGKGGAGGDVSLRWSFRPLNDNWGDAQLIAGVSGTVAGHNGGAEKEVNEPTPTGQAGGHSIWYRYTAPYTGTASFDTCGSSLDTLLGVYTGTFPGNAVPVGGGENDNTPGCGGGVGSKVTVNVTAGTTYRVQIDGKNGATGPVALYWRFAPLNDAFAAAQVVTGMTGVVTGTNFGASKETGEPTPAGQTGGSSVWYSYTVPVTGLVSFNTCDATLDTLLGIYTGPSVNQLVAQAQNDDVAGCGPNGTGSAVSKANVAAGTQLWIQVDGKNGAVGGFTLDYGTYVPVPSGDDFADATAISGQSGIAPGTNVGATKQAGEPTPTGQAGGHSIWYSYTAPYSGKVVFDTCASGFDTLLGVYTGTVVDGLFSVGENDNVAGCGGGTRSSVTINAVAGTTYRVQVDGKNGATGPVGLYWRFDPVNDFFDFAEVISGPSGSWPGTNFGATLEAGEPTTVAGFDVGKSIWYSYTPASSGLLTVDTCGSEFDTLLGVYTGSAVNALSSVTEADGGCNDAFNASSVTFPVSAGTNYRIGVTGWDPGTGAYDGPVFVNWSLAAQPSVSIGDAFVVEGDGGPAAVSFPVRLSAAAATPVTVQYSTSNGTATTASPADYAAKTAQTLTIPAGALGGNLSVPVNGDRRPEQDEAFFVTLSSPTGAVLGRAIGQGIIFNNDLPRTPTVAIGDVTVIEGHAGTAKATFDVTLDVASAGTVTVPWSISPVNATAGSDYVNGSDTLTFPAGTTSRTIGVTVKGDTTIEPLETATVNLGAPTGATVGDGTGTLSIVNDDAGPANALSIGSVALTEGDNANHTATLTVRLAQALPGPVTVNYQTNPGTATAGKDYTPKSGTLTILAGKTSANITVPIIADGLDEAAQETLNVTLSNPSANALLATATGTITIRDDDPTQAVLSLGYVAAVEGNAGTRTVNVPVTLSQPQAGPVTFVINTTPGGTAGPSDYAAIVNRTITIPAGKTSVSIPITVKSDLLTEGNSPENALLTPTNLTGATLSPPLSPENAAGPTGILFIIDDD